MIECMFGMRAKLIVSSCSKVVFAIVSDFPISSPNFSSTFGISSKIPGEKQNHGAAVTTAAVGIVIAYARGFLEAQFTGFSCSRLP